MNLIFMLGVSEREPAIRQFVSVKNKLMSVFNIPANSHALSVSLTPADLKL